MNKAFYERVLFEKVEELKKSEIYGIDKSDLVKIRIIDWGTNRDGTPFENETYKKDAIAYMKKDTMGIPVTKQRWLMDRGYVLGLE